jgi:hypothetical protein
MRKPRTFQPSADRLESRQLLSQTAMPHLAQARPAIAAGLGSERAALESFRAARAAGLSNHRFQLGFLHPIGRVTLLGRTADFNSQGGFSLTVTSVAPTRGTTTGVTTTFGTTTTGTNTSSLTSNTGNLLNGTAASTGLLFSEGLAFGNLNNPFTGGLGAVTGQVFSQGLGSVNNFGMTGFNNNNLAFLNALRTMNGL